jgi:hypothetical protein
MEQYQEQNNIRALIYGTLISADNDEYTEEQKQESMRRYGLATAGEKDWDNLDWDYILEPFESPNSKNKLADLFK